MASVKVAVRVRPFNQREIDMNAKLIVQMEGKKTRLLTVKNSKDQIDRENREKYKDFTFDHSYWSYDHTDSIYASQEQVFSELGLDVIDSAFEGYNACVFAYGQTGSGKTFTMMGSGDNQGLIPRICRQLFSRVSAGKESGSSFRTEVSYLEIYNERVKDLLASDAGHSLRVREHPKLGPYVQDLSKHLVLDYDDIQECMHRGNLHRTTASTQMNDVSSRSHAIFTITFVQASYLRHNNMPCETVSKVHLVDLAGSERADATGATGQRLVEGAHINKSLVTLGSVISALAESSQILDSRNGAKGGKKAVFIPYRDSVLTWLLKDSLGGNSKTIMIAAISPADCNYGETLSTLRYANRAKNIINKPTINEDPNVKLIRELREEIDKLRAQITHTTDPIENDPGVLATLQRKEAQEKVLTEKWTEKWRETQQILQEQKALGLRKSGLGVVLDSDMPHLVGIDDNLLSTGVTLYHLKEGETVIGTDEHVPLPDIVLTGAGVMPLHCVVELRGGSATLRPAPAAHCWLNTVLVDQPARLTQGCILLLGRTNMFRYNDPAEAAKLRQEGSTSVMNLSRLSLLSWSTTDLAASTENLNTQLSDLESDIRNETLEAQRAELERERQQFIQQQEDRQRRWQQEQQQLLQAQKELLQERSAMEREFALAVGTASGKRRALRARRRELAARRQRLRARAETHAHAAECEDRHVDELTQRVEESRAQLDDYVQKTTRDLVNRGCNKEYLSSDSSSETPTDCLMRLLKNCDEDLAKTIRTTVERKKKELSDFEDELSGRIACASRHRTKVDELRSELGQLRTQQQGLSQYLPTDADSDSSPSDGVKRSKSELVLRRGGRELSADTFSADESEQIREKKANMTLELDPLNVLSGDDTFHTATSSPKPQPSSPLESKEPSNTPKTQDDTPKPDFKLGPAAQDDSDDMSSTDDYNKPRIVEGQSSSSTERSPEERHQTAKYRRRLTSENKRRQVTEAEALRAMQRLCSRIASQKLLVISSLENDCSKEDLNRQIAVLQDLQKKYVRLEMALQYSFFDNQQHNRRTMVVTPIQETPSLTLSESDMHITTETIASESDSIIETKRQDTETEGSDNVSTSNDSLQERRPRVQHPLSEQRIHQDELEDVPLPNPTIIHGLMPPVNFDEVISIPGWVTRGAGTRTHHEYEVRLALPEGACSLLRRYRRFRDLRLAARAAFPAAAALPFPPRQLWSGEAVARARRPALEAFLRRLLAACAADRRCVLHGAPVTRDSLLRFSPFFRKGVFESGKCGTG